MSAPSVLRPTRDSSAFTAMVAHVHAFPIPNAQGQTLYELHLMVYFGADNGACVCTNRTLSEFLALHSTLRRRKATRFRFDLPSKTWFGNRKPSTIRYRAMRLDKYIKHALAVPAVRRDPLFMAFAGIDRAMALRAASDEEGDDDDDAASVISSTRSVGPVLRRHRDIAI